MVTYTYNLIIFMFCLESLMLQGQLRGKQVTILRGPAAVND